MPGEDFALAEEQFCRVDKQACVAVRTNRYSTPLRPGTQAQVRVWPTTVEILAAGAAVATHPRSYGRLQQVIELEHYLTALNVNLRVRNRSNSGAPPDVGRARTSKPGKVSNNGMGHRPARGR